MFADQEYVSSLPLQIALYFNVFYFPVWITAEIVMLVAKVNWTLLTDYYFLCCIQSSFSCYIFLYTCLCI